MKTFGSIEIRTGILLVDSRSDTVHKTLDAYDGRRKDLGPTSKKRPPRLSRAGDWGVRFYGLIR